MRKRIDGLDLWRSAAVAAMLVYHALYDLEYFGVLAPGSSGRPLALALRWACAGSFILISGAAARFSRSPLRRGFFLLCVGLAVTAVTMAVRRPVLFGILHCLGVCQLLYGAAKARIAPRDRKLFALVCAALFAGTAVLTRCVTVDIKFLFPLGLRYEGFYSADYYPLLPWAFLFLLGTLIGENLEIRSGFRSFPRWATFAGRHSLLIYLLHQPILLGLAWTITKFT